MRWLNPLKLITILICNVPEASRPVKKGLCLYARNNQSEPGMPVDTVNSLNIVTSHQNADLDGLASMVALARWRGPLLLALPAGMDPDTHRFYEENRADLPEILSLGPLRQRLEGAQLGTLLVADTAQAARLGALAEWVPRFAAVLAWDTHPPTAEDLPRAPAHPTGGACVSGLVLQLAAAGVQPTPAEAGLFLLGIHQDTGHFTFAGTQPVDHEAAAQCVRWGAPLEWPARYVPRGFTRAQLLLLEEMARHVELVEPADAVRLPGQSALSVALVAFELPAFEPNLAVLVEQLREAEGWLAAVAVVSMGDRCVLIGRSRGALDVAELMHAFGGGGHSEAASAMLRNMTLKEATQAVRQALQEALGQNVTAAQLASRPVLSLPATALVRDAADALHRLRINALPLMRGRGAARRCVGMVSRAEVEAALRHGFAARPVRDISGQAPTWVRPDAPLSEAWRELVVGTRRLLLVGVPPVAEGVLTRGQLLRATVPAASGATQRPPQAQVVLAMLRKHLGSSWELVSQLSQLATRETTAIYLVGGTVRDLLLGMAGRDLDIMVEGAAPAFAKLAAQALGGAVELPAGFETACWTPPNHPAIDFASARAEYYAAPAALPQVEHASLNQDLFRRDFTLNAMALSLSGARPGRIYDPYGGFGDLRAGVLRVLHGLSFHDDPTRAYRAVRLAARLDFQLAPDTQGLLRAAVRAGVMDKISHERLGAELELLLGEREVVQAFRLVRQWGLGPRIHPKFRADRSLLDRLRSAQQARLQMQGVLLAHVPAQADVLWVVLAAAVPAQDRPARARLLGGGRARRQRWLTGPERIADALAAFERPDPPRWSRLLAGLDAAERVCVFAFLGAQRSAAQAHVIWWEQVGQSIKSSVDGHALRGLGFTAGPHFKDALAVALDQARLGANAEAQLSSAVAFLRSKGSLVQATRRGPP